MNKDDLQQAVALFYDGEHSPVVTAKGEGATAEAMIELAREHNITLCENHALLTLLMTLELGEEIPESLYIAIAQIIAFAYQLQGKSIPKPPKPQ
ncbi:MAG: EscU/YscU/HrcU family type III secretion system export apparatus switch protein [Cellvibrionaceae bacterium]|nr:EscU/YscU/HrcU family type III secretion system export apparatus switch protein [Cellvibrionaceae bacterium]